MGQQNSVAVWTIRGALAPLTKGLSVRLNLALLLAVVIPLTAYAQGPTPGQNVNMVSGTKWPDGDAFLQRQNESSIAVSSRNVCHLLAGANDYRSVDLNFFATGETGDAWLGLFKSFDCGATWQSTLFPGYRLDQTPEGKPSPLKPFNAASDPVVRSGPSGFFGYSGIAFNRGTNNGVVFFGRLVDLNNKENGTAATGAANSNTDAIRFAGTTVVATGSATRFLDKPWMAIDVARHGGGCNLQVPLPGGSSVTQSLAVGNIYVAFTAFNYNQMGALISSQILFSRSSDCGTHWSTPVTLSASDNSLNQGATIAIDPQTGFVYVAWRRFASPNRADAIVAAASISGGQWFTPAIPVITLPKFDPVHPATGPNGPFSFFDQGTTGGSMRMDAFPSLAVADSGKSGIPGQIYLAWAQRGVGPKGEARIVLASSPDCVRWVPPFPIDNGPVPDDLGNLFTNGHQFSPQLTFSGGKLAALYYDLRFEDHTIGTFNAVSGFPLPDSLGRFVLQTRNPCPFSPIGGLLICNGDPLEQVITPYLNDAGLTGRRHTLGVTMAQFDPQTTIFGPGAFKTAQVSQFAFGTRGDGTSFLQQLQFNVPNLPIFMGGTAPFLGDYLDIAGPTFALKNGSWVYSTGPSSASAFHATWTDNRDIKPPLDGDWTKYAPVNLDPSQNSSTSVFDPTQNRPSCLVDANGSLQHEGERNQNIYTSQITQGLRVSSPQNSKPLSTTIQRAFVVFVQNFTSSDRSFRLAISSPQPTGGFASFVAGKNNPPGSPTPPSPVITSLDVTIAARSGVVRSVFAVSSQTAASITVTATEIAGLGGNPVPGGLSSFVVLNPDPLNPALTNPDGAPAGSDITTVEIYEPNLHTPNLHTDNITDPNLHTPNLHTDTIGDAGVANAVATPTNLTNVFNLSIADPNLHTPNLHTADIAAPNLHTPNLHTVAPSSAMTDATYVFSDAGNTAASYHVRLVGSDPGIALQVIVTNYYATPVATECKLALQPAHSVLATASNAVVQSPANFNPADTGITDGSTGNVTFTVPPAGIVLVTIRANVDEATMQSSILSKVAPFVVPHAANTNDATNTPKFTAPLFISTSTLPDGVAFQESSFYSAAVQAIGGKTPYQSWSIIAGSLPPGLSLSLDTETGRGLISGFPSAVGTFNFTVQVTDATGDTAFRQFSIRVAAPLTITTSPSLTQTVSTPFVINLTSTGGIAPILWSATGLPNWLSLTPAGVLSGTPPTTGTSIFTATVSDSASPAQTRSKSISLNVVPATPAPPTGLSTLLFDNFNAAGVTQQLGGPTNTTTFVLTSTTEITQLATYHFNNGQGAAPGTIGFRRGDQNFGPFPAVGVAGQGGPNEAWVATPNVIVPAGTYTIVDSDPTTWSYNATSFNSAGLLNCGFTRVWGFAVQVNALTFVTPPADTPLGQLISPSVQVKATDSSPVPAALPFIDITISIGSNPSGGTLSGTLTKTTDATGIATFSNLSIDKAGSGYTLLASSASTSPVTAASNQFSITNLCAAFPTGYVPFTTIYSVARDTAGDAFVVGALNGGIQAFQANVPLPNQPNQQYCNPVTLETNYTVLAFVPTGAERAGDLRAYPGLVLIDPATNAPFPTPNVIPPDRIGSVFAWRIAPHSSTLPRLSCSLEPTLYSIEGHALTATSIRFANNTAGSVNVYWINYQGQRVLYLAGLASGQSFNQGTFITHPWIVTDATSNACLGIWLPTESPGVAAITGIAISSVNLSSTTLTIGGATVPYTAILSNGTGATVSSVSVQAYIDQGTASRAAGGAVVTCAQTLGDLPPGSCTFNWQIVPSNSNAGNGTLVPGTATARFELHGPNALLDVFTVPVTLAAAPSAGSRYLIVADGRSSPSSIFRIVPDGSSTALVATLATGRAIAVSIDPTTNTLYSADPFNAEVWKVSLWGGAMLPLFVGSPLASPVAVAVDSAGNVYVGDNSTDAVYKITPAGTLALFANLPASPTNLQDIRMAFDASGNLVVGSDFVGDVANVSEIDRISPTGVSTTVYNSATMNGGTAIKEIGGLAIDVSGNIVVADYASSSIVKIANPGTSTMTATTLITDASLGGSTAITGLTVVDSAAGIYDLTANFGNQILSVNTSTNTITTLVSGAPLTYPTDIAMSGFIPTPQPATNVTAVVKSSIPPSVTLNWTASTSAVTGYNVYRKRNGGAFTKIASVLASATSYTDTGVAFGDSLDYYVTSVDSSNVESVPSNVVHTGLA